MLGALNWYLTLAALYTDYHHLLVDIQFLMHLEIVYIASAILEKRFGLKHRVTLISSNFLKLSFQKFHVVFDFCGVSSCQALFSIGNLCMIMRPTKMNGTKRPNAS